MNILHVIDSGGLYGAEVMLLNLASEQIKQGEIPLIISIAGPEDKEKAIEMEAKKRCLVVHRVTMRKGFDHSGAKKILSYAFDNKIDVIHSHGYKPNIILGALSKKKELFH